MPWSFFVVQQVLGLLRVEQVHSLSLSFWKMYYALCVNWAQVIHSASSIYLEKSFFSCFWLSTVMHILLLESNSGKHLLFIHSRTVLRLPWALLSREKETWESCQKVREWEFETEWDSEQAFIYATIFNPTPSRLSQGFLSRTLRKQAWLGFLSARWAVQSQGRIALWWPGTDSKRKKS